MNIKIIYIDDDIDTSLSKFLANKYGDSYDEQIFKCEEGYADLLKMETIKQSNVIIIDSKLFENNRVKDKKFTGEEFKIILRKIFPFVEVIVLTQNDDKEDVQTISKFKERHDGQSPDDYYDEVLIPRIENSIKNVESFRLLAQRLSNNDNIDRVLVEKIKNSLDGVDIYDELDSKDIDELICSFEELKKVINE